MDDVIHLEEEGWQALRAGGEHAVAFYDGVLDTRVTMLLPGGLVITSRAAALESMSGTPWDESHLDDWDVQHPADGVALVTYAARARRSGEPYAALVASLYVRRPGGWRLAFHQQTPR